MPADLTAQPQWPNCSAQNRCLLPQLPRRRPLEERLVPRNIPLQHLSLARWPQSRIRCAIHKPASLSSSAFEIWLCVVLGWRHRHGGRNYRWRQSSHDLPVYVINFHFFKSKAVGNHVTKQESENVHARHLDRSRIPVYHCCWVRSENLNNSQ